MDESFDFNQVRYLKSFDSVLLNSHSSNLNLDLF